MFLAYWSQDSSNDCNMIRDTGYTSWSLSCQNKHNVKTSCSTLIASVENQYTDIKWKFAAKYVHIFELEFKNHTPIIKQTVDNNAFEAMTEIQKFSEIKDCVLIEKFSMRTSLRTSQTLRNGLSKCCSDSDRGSRFGSY